MKHLFKYLAGLALVAIAGVALAQQVVLPSALPLGQTDQVQIIKGGAPQAQSYYAPASTLNAVSSYQNLGVLATGQTIAVTSANLFAQSAGTIAALTLTAPANPSDGQHFCYTNTQATTAVTITPASGQTVSNSPSAGVANVPLCWVFVKANSNWYIGQ